MEWKPLHLLTLEPALVWFVCFSSIVWGHLSFQVEGETVEITQQK